MPNAQTPNTEAVVDFRISQPITPSPNASIQHDEALPAQDFFRV
jgi:hypothetical protein